MPSPFMSNKPVRRHRRRRPWLLALLGLLVVAGAAVGAYFAFVKKEGNTYNPHAAFESQAPQKPKARPENFKWPFYGYTPQRTRYLDVNLKPPYKELWHFG